jgi:hypothetical protein
VGVREKVVVEGEKEPVVVAAVAVRVVAESN